MRLDAHQDVAILSLEVLKLDQFLDIMTSQALYCESEIHPSDHPSVRDS